MTLGRCTTTNYDNKLQLVDEILCEIFKYLRGDELESVSATCRDWYHLMNSSPMNRNIIKEWGLYVLGGYGAKGLDSVVCYEPKSSKWRYKKPMPTPRCHFATAVCKRCIYVFGGRVNEQRLDDALRYNLATMEWETLLSMKHIRSAATSAVIGNSIYVIGGFDGKKEHMTVERFDTKSMRWFYDVPDTPIPLSDAAATSVGEHIYVIGGATECDTSDEKVLSTCIRYSLSNNKWDILSPMRIPRLFPAVSVAQGNIYVMGGVTPDHNGSIPRTHHNGLLKLTWIKDTEIYNVKEDKWVAGPPLRSERQNPTGVTFLDSIYVMGGYCRDPLSTVEVLNLNETEWKPFLDLPEPRDACRAIVLL